LANKRLSELNELLYNQVEANDLFLISDISEVESKKITAESLRMYASNTGSISGSLYGTSSWAKNSLTASYLLYTGIFNGTASYAISSSHSDTASYADLARTASYVMSASYALSASWAARSISASYAATCSITFALSSSIADQSKTASYLLYQGFGNGTASYALSASLAAYTYSSSFLIYTGAPNGTASYAINSLQAVSSSLARSSSFLIYTGSPNGTASYSISSSIARWANFVKKPMAWGNYPSTVTHATQSKIISMSLAPTNGVASQTLITAYGTAVFPYTSSVNDSGSITLGVIEHSTLIETVLDSTWIGYRQMGATISGALIIPFVLTGEQYMNPGSWTLYVSSSTINISLDTRRPSVFRVDSQTDSLFVTP
jgi:hypothetical protein